MPAPDLPEKEDARELSAEREAGLVTPAKIAAIVEAERAERETWGEKPLSKLRTPFAPAAVGKLYKAFQKNQAPKARCQECGAYHSTAPGVHLDYAGHAAVTDRLLSVDLSWNWEPLAFDEKGLPRFVVEEGQAVGLWIRLTVCGVTRLGFGSVESGAHDAEKQLISDAIRNGAMRFGVALDLWSKEELESQLGEPQAQTHTAEKWATPKQNGAPLPKPAAVNVDVESMRADWLSRLDEPTDRAALAFVGSEFGKATQNPTHPLHKDRAILARYQEKKAALK
jgi:hypothetical protein